MTDTWGPETLRALAAGLPVHVPSAERAALSAHADAWETERSSCAAHTEQLDAERLANGRLMEQLADVQKRLDVLEQDLRWWKDNAIKRRKRSAARRSESPSRKRDRT